jgi:exonuclease SbcC
LGIEVARLTEVDQYDEVEIAERLMAMKTARQHLEKQLPDTATALTNLTVAEVRLKNKRQKLEELGQECQKLESKLQELCQVRSDITRLETSLKATSEIRQAIRQAGPEVAKRLLASISHEADRMFAQAWSHQAGRLRIEPDYNVIVSFNGYERPFTLCSGGQQVTAALAIRLALAKTVGIKLLVCDESTMGALEPDDPARLVIPEWLSSLRDFQIIVVDHSGLFDTASNTIKVEMTNGESHAT